MWRMSEGLANAGHEVTILSIHTDKHPWSEEKIGAENIRRFRMESVYVDTSVRWLPAFLSLFKSSSYNIERFYNLGFEARLIELLARNQFDLVQIESLYMCPYIATIRRVSKAKIALRAHNCESAIWKKNAEDETDTFKKLWFRDLSGKLERYERKAINEVDAVIPITTEDENRLKSFTTTSIPFHTSTYAMVNPSSGIEFQNQNTGAVFHIGSMDWKPNHDGVNWLVNEIWPLVLQKQPDAKLHLAGRDMRKEEFAGKQGIVAHGEVPDAKEFMSRYSIMAVPLRSGGGVKVKVIEGMFSSKAIVTTKVGIEGIAMKHRSDFLLAATAQEFADHLIELLTDTKLTEELGRNALKSANENHELSRVTEKLSDFYATILR